MLSDEEKAVLKTAKENYGLTSVEQKILVNLIEKQSKEIEELKEDNKHQWEERCKLTFKLENSTPNDKIKAKIEELENEKEKYFEKQVIQHEIEILQSLLKKG